MIKMILGIATIVAIIGIAILTLIWVLNPPEDIDQKRLFLDAYMAIGIGFLVTLMGTIIPNLVQEGRDKFERAKESRTAYSQAKTSVIYLPGTLAVMSYGQAMNTLEMCHQKLHIAETYGKELDEFLSWYGNRHIWSELIYWKLTAVRTLLQKHADQWQEKSLSEKTHIIANALTEIEKLFGRRGVNWRKLSQAEREIEPKKIIEKLTKS